MKKNRSVLGFTKNILIYFVSFILLYIFVSFGENNNRQLIENTLHNYQDETINQLYSDSKYNIDEIVGKISYINIATSKRNISSSLRKIYKNNKSYIDGIFFIGRGTKILVSDKIKKFSLSESYIKKSKNGTIIVDNLGHGYFVAKIFKPDNNIIFVTIFNLKNLITRNIKFKKIPNLNNPFFYSIDFISKGKVINIANVNNNQLLLNKVVQKFLCYTNSITYDYFDNNKLKIKLVYLKYSIITLLIIFLIPLFIVLILNLVLFKKYHEPLSLVIKKLRDLRLGDFDGTWLPFDRSDIVGDLVREFGNTYGDLIDLNKKILENNGELLEKSKFIDQKLLEVEKLRSLVLKSFSNSNQNDLIRELLLTFKDVFKCDNAVLTNINSVEEDVIQLDFFALEDGDFKKYDSFVRKEHKEFIKSNKNMISKKFKNLNFLIAKVKFDSKLIAIITLVRDKMYKKQELDVVMTFVGQAAIVLENQRLYKQEIEKVKLDLEMEGAKVIQKLIITKDLSHIDNVEVVSYYKPAVNVGGDWYDYFKIDDDNSIFLIADITGHGISSALITSIFSTYFSVLKTLIGRNLFLKYGLDFIISGLNKVLYNLTGGVKQATMVVALYNHSKRELTYLSAGHNASFLYSNNKGVLKPIQTRNTRLGDSPNVSFNIKKISLEKNDKLFIFTDGLIENKTKQGVEYGKKRIRKLLENNFKSLDINSIAQKVKSDIELEFDLDNLEDDITYLIIDFK